EFSKIPKDHVENSKATTSPPSSFPFYHDSQLQCLLRLEVTTVSGSRVYDLTDQNSKEV
ncbi:unnamed protein product, partial [Brassica oleracea]